MNRVVLLLGLEVSCRASNPAFEGVRRADAAIGADLGVVALADAGPDRSEALIESDAALDPCAPNPVTTLVGHWSFDETAGLTAADRSCGHNDGTLMGFVNPPWRAGMVRGAMELDGAAQWVKVSDVNDHLDAVVTTGALTLSAWVFRAGYMGAWSGVATRQYRDTAREHFSLSFREYMVAGVAHVPAFFMNNYDPVPSGAETSCTGPSEVPLGQWMHIAATYDGSVARLYLDGNEICSFARQTSFVPETNPLIIGSENNGAAEAPNESFQGMIDEVLFYSRAMSAAEIAALAKGGAPPAG